MCAKRKLGSACASVQSDQNFRLALQVWVAKAAIILHPESETVIIRLRGCPYWSESSSDRQAKLYLPLSPFFFVVVFKPLLKYFACSVILHAFGICWIFFSKSFLENFLEYIQSVMMVRSWPFANSLDPDKAWQNVDPYLGSKLCWH